MSLASQILLFDLLHPWNSFRSEEILMGRELLRVIETAGGDINVACSLHRFVRERCAARWAKCPPRLRRCPVTLRPPARELKGRFLDGNPRDRLSTHRSSAILAVAIALKLGRTRGAVAGFTAIAPANNYVSVHRWYTVAYCFVVSRVLARSLHTLWHRE